MDTNTVIAWAAAAQAFLALVLIAVTARYVVLTGRLAKSAQDQIALALTPNLIFEAAADPDKGWYVANLGVHSAHMRAVYIELLDPRDDSVVGRGLLNTDKRVIWGWKKFLGPNQEIEMKPEPPGKDSLVLGGLVRLVFYFVYGPTGARTHALNVKLRIREFGETKVLEQTIRLDEGPPQLPATSTDQIQPVKKTDR